MVPARPPHHSTIRGCFGATWHQAWCIPAGIAAYESTFVWLLLVCVGGHGSIPTGTSAGRWCGACPCGATLSVPLKSNARFAKSTCGCNSGQAGLWPGQTPLLVWPGCRVIPGQWAPQGTAGVYVNCKPATLCNFACTVLLWPSGQDAACGS